MTRQAALALLPLLTAAAPTFAQDAGEPERPPVFAVYYTWYATGHGPHQTWAGWGSAAPSLLRPDGADPAHPGEPPFAHDIASMDYPLAGAYDSTDPEVVRWHLRLAKAAGIDALLVDWWGSGGWQTVPGLTHDAFVDVVLPLAQEEGVKVALFDETAQFVEDFETVKTWAADYLAQFKDHPAYLHIDGEPVYVVYQVPFAPSLTPETATELKDHVEARVGPVHWMIDKIANGQEADGVQPFVVPPDWLALDWVDTFCAYGTFSVQRVHGYEALAPRFKSMADLAHGAGHRVMLPAHPGHDNSKLQTEPFVIPRRGGQTLLDYLNAAQDAGADYILLTSFNEWPETTQIEPSVTWDDPYFYLRLIAAWKGVEFVPPPPG